jgi:hypothetical protein
MEDDESREERGTRSFLFVGEERDANAIDGTGSTTGL